MPRNVIAITGASSGIGAEFARRLAPDHDLLLIARRKYKLQEVADEMTTKYGCQVETLAADLSDDADLERVAEKLAQEPRLTMLVNNAGFGTKGRFWELPLESQLEMHKLHVLATVRLTHAALQVFTRQNNGAVINVASVSAFIRAQGSVSYCATKSWMTAFSEGLYLELKGSGSQVRVQALCPGFTTSGFHEAMGVERSKAAAGAYWLKPEDVVNASLEGLRRNKLFVVPNWRYRLITAIFSKVPTALRLRMEAVGGHGRVPPVQTATAEGKLGQ